VRRAYHGHGDRVHPTPAETSWQLVLHAHVLYTAGLQLAAGGPHRAIYMICDLC
jgi:hypothetical protein